MKRILIFALLASVTWSVAQTKPSAVEQEVLRVENARIEAILHADTAALERLLSDDLTYTHSTGRVDSKTSFIRSIQSGDLTYVAIQPDELRVRVYGDAAVLTGRSAMKVKSPRLQNQTLDLDVRFLIVYAKQDGHWRQVAWQSTRIAPQ